MALRDTCLWSLGSATASPPSWEDETYTPEGQAAPQGEGQCGWHVTRITRVYSNEAERRAGRGSAQEHPQTDPSRRGCSGRRRAEADGDTGRGHMPPIQSDETVVLMLVTLAVESSPLPVKLPGLLWSSSGS